MLARAAWGRAGASRRRLLHLRDRTARRINAPHRIDARQARSTGANNCLDVIELDDGDFYVIGKLLFLSPPKHERLREQGASVRTGETAVVMPRDCVLAAAKQLAAEGLVG
ncbi:hypothetical protein ABT186_33545 [Streptomyces sp. NPDC001634]|uniref:hypothetical protein n=1 Tax=Streptomyces sp. NPDC001634 TaxID=3154390 RepID=UPI00331F957B